MSHFHVERTVELPGSFTVMQGLPGDGLLNTLDTSPSFKGCPRTATSGNHATITRAIDAWQRDRAQKAKAAGDEWWQQATHPSGGGNNSEAIKTSTREAIPILFAQQHKWWVDPVTCQLRIFSALPQPIPTDVNASSARTVAPGSICLGTALHTFEYSTRRSNYSFVGSCAQCSPTTTQLPAKHRPRAGIIQYLQIESPCSGYVLFSVDGYPVLAPGMSDSSLYTGQSSHTGSGVVHWWWKVTCPAGAFVRQGVELSSRHMGTVPFGSVVQVTRKVVNDSGLARLFVKASVSTTGSRFEGWCSEFLNPLSGQRGPIVQPIPPAVPILSRVVLQAGSTVRKDVELGSPMVETVPIATSVAVTGRVFTEFPQTGCIPRLILCPGQAYASQRLNKQQQGATSPTSSALGELVYHPSGECDARFDADQAGLYHWKLHLQWTESSNDSSKPEAAAARTQPQQTLDRPPPGGGVTKNAARCVVCEQKEPNAMLVHGETGHICCCFECAKMCKAKNTKCPMCGLPIEQVITYYYS